jgi:hypothetical protein
VRRPETADRMNREPFPYRERQIQERFLFSLLHRFPSDVSRPDHCHAQQLPTNATLHLGGTQLVRHAAFM